MLIIGALYCIGLLGFFVPHISKINSLDGEEVSLRVVVVDEPKLNGDTVMFVVKPTDDNVDFKLVGERLKFKIFVNSEQEASTAVAGDILQTELRFYSLGEIGRQSSMSEGIFISAYCKSAEITGHEESFVTKLVLLRQSIKRAIYRYSSGDDAALIKGLLLGGTEEMSDELYSEFKTCGVTHICAVSGMHIGSFCVMSVTALGLFMRRRKASLCSIVTVLIICLLSGLTPSAVRSAIMCTVLLLGEFIFRKPDSLNSLGVAVAVMLTVNPYYILSISFQLSCCATAGVILITPWAMRMAERLPEIGSLWILNRALSVVVVNVIQSIGSVLCTLPILIAEFGYVSLISPVVSALISSAAVYAMGFAAFGVLLFFVPFVDVVAVIPFSVAVLFVKYIRIIVGAFAKVPFASIPVERNDALIWVLVSLLIFGVWLCFRLPFKRWVAVALVAALLSVSLGVNFIRSYDTVNTAVLKTDKGFCAVVSSKKKCIVFGCGNDRSDTYELNSYLKTNGISDVEALFIPSAENICFKGYDYVASKTSPGVTVIGKRFEKRNLLLDEVIQATDGMNFEFFGGSVTVTVYNYGTVAWYQMQINDVRYLICCGNVSVPKECSQADVLIMAKCIPSGVSAETVVSPSASLSKDLMLNRKSKRVFVATEDTIVVKSKKGKGMAVYAG